MVTKLQLYNGALSHLGPVRLTSVGENRPDRYELDAVYDKSLQAMLEQGIWFFALRSQRWEPDTDVEARFGLPFTYTMPDDFVRIRSICTDEAQTNEDRSYKREGRQIFSAQSLLYLTYVSNDPLYGLNLGAFPQLYADAVEADLAERSGLPITKDRATKGDLIAIKARLLQRAKRVDAVDERVKAKPTSSWVNSRGGGNSSQRRDPRSTGIGNGE